MAPDPWPVSADCPQPHLGPRRPRPLRTSAAASPSSSSSSSSSSASSTPAPPSAATGRLPVRASCNRHRASRRDKLNLDIFWLKDDSLEDIDSLPAPDVLAAEIVENLEAALEQFRSVAQELGEEV